MDAAPLPAHHKPEFNADAGHCHPYATHRINPDGLRGSRERRRAADHGALGRWQWAEKTAR